jgi:hypothetical protein
MTQPDKPVPARGARPQLFGEPGAGKAGSPRQPDFGPSILATIDGTPPRRDPRSRDATPLKRVLWMSALALGVVAVYFGVKFGMLPGDAPSSAPPLATVPAAAPVVKLVEPAAPAAPAEQVAQAAPGASAPEGSATIETVAAAPMPSASAAEASTPATGVAASLSSIQQTLARSEPTEARKAAKPAASKEAPSRAKERASPAKDASKDTVVAEARPAAAPSPKPAAKAGNDDADLLAAMLPHLKRRGAAPTSPAYERRCGQLAGDAAAECRAKFCNGREGVDAACPSAASR